MTELRPAGSPVEGERALRLLREGRLSVEGRLVDASNATLYCSIELDGLSANCVYKPVAGERPLWDFPDGTLAGREVAAYAVSHALGWEVVPPTVHRDGPFGPGMCQLWIHADPEVDLVELAQEEGHAGLRRMAIFDAVVNNSDRKIGHLLPTPEGHLYGCDHGVCFSVDYKLRTVLWQWQGTPLPEDALADLRRLLRALKSGPLAAQLPTYVTEREVWAAHRRVELLVEHGIHPYPSEDWPSVPWPPI